MADDIFEKIWSQLGRIYDSLGRRDTDRKNDASGTKAGSFVADKAIRALGLQEVAKFITLATGDLSRLVSGSSSESNDAPRRNIPKALSVAERVVTHGASDAGIGSDMSEAVAEISRIAKEGANLGGVFADLSRSSNDLREQINDVNQALGSKLIKPFNDYGGKSLPGSGQDPNADRGPRSLPSEDSEAQLDRIGDLLTQIVAQNTDLIEAVKELKPEGDLTEEIIGKIKEGVAAAAGGGKTANSGGGRTSLFA